MRDVFTSLPPDVARWRPFGRGGRRSRRSWGNVAMLCMVPLDRRAAPIDRRRSTSAAALAAIAAIKSASCRRSYNPSRCRQAGLQTSHNVEHNQRIILAFRFNFLASASFLPGGEPPALDGGASHKRLGRPRTSVKGWNRLRCFSIVPQMAHKNAPERIAGRKGLIRLRPTLMVAFHKRLSAGRLGEAELHLCSGGGARPFEAFPIDAPVGREFREAPAKRFTAGEAESDLFSFAGVALDMGSVPALQTFARRQGLENTACRSLDANFVRYLPRPAVAGQSIPRRGLQLHPHIVAYKPDDLRHCGILQLNAG